MFGIFKDEPQILLQWKKQFCWQEQF